MTLGAGADTVNVNAGTDSITNLTTADTLNVSAGATASLSSANNDVLDMTSLASYTNNGTVALDNTGGATATIIGAAGVESITAGANGDTITGGAGNDVITLGAGADTVVRNGDGTTDGTDTIDSFTAGTDIIDFTTSAVANVTTAGGLLLAAGIDDGNNDTITANKGLVIVDNGDANVGDAVSLSTSDVATYLAEI